MYIKYLSRPNWKRVLKREYSFGYRKDENFEGAVSLIHMLKVSEPCIKRHDDFTIKIADDGFYWLQLAPKNKNWWLTVMFNEQEEITQYYFDITQENDVYEDKESSFKDLYLDIVLTPDKRIYVLDEDELIEAYQKKEISEKEMELAYRIKDELTASLPQNEEKLHQYCTKIFYELKEKLKSCIK